MNEHHLLQLQKLRNRGIGNVTTKNILVELMKAEEVDFGKGIVGTLLIQLQNDTPRGKYIDMALDKNLFVNEPILLELLRDDQWYNGRPCAIIEYIYMTLCMMLIKQAILAWSEKYCLYLM